MESSLLPRILSIVVLICSWKIQLSSCVVAEILEPPTNQTVPTSQAEARFSCYARASAVFWLVNDNLLTSNVPNWITIYPDVHDFDLLDPKVTREIGVLTAGHNNTKVVCHATGSSQTTDTSDPAWLEVVGVPEPPSPQLAVINSTAISVTWNKPFSTPGFDILRYTLNVHNGTSSSIVLTKVFDASGIGSYPVQYSYISPSISHSDCHNLSMEVTASNSVGISEAGVAAGGFPIAPRDFIDTPVTLVTFSTVLLPIVSVTFKLPVICWFQTGTYHIQIMNSQSMQEVVPPRQGNYIDGANPIIVSETFYSGFERERFYDAIITAETLAGTSNITFHFNTTTTPPPEQDVPHLNIINSTAIEVTWNRSSTFQQDVAISYTLVIRNETDKLDLVAEVFNLTANFTSYPMSYVLIISDTVFEECHNVSFNILAMGGGRIEGPGSAISGFPIAPPEFTNEPTAEISFSPPSFVPKVDISFKYPTVCWFQSRTYRVQIVDNATELVVEERGPLTANREDLVVTETFSGLDRHKNYIARVYADSFAGSVNTTVDFTTVFTLPTVSELPTTSEVPTTSKLSSTAETEGIISTEESNMIVVIGASVATFVVLLLLLGVFVIITLCLWRARMRKIKAQRRRRPLPLVDNPLYEAGPIYEEIPGEAKGFTSLPRQPRSQASEYVMIEGMGNGQTKYYDVIGPKSEEKAESKKLKNDTSSKVQDLGLSLPTDYIFPISGPTLTPGEDAYTLMNPAGALTASIAIDKNGHCTSGSKSTECLPCDDTPSFEPHARIRPSYSLPLGGIAGNISGDNGTPEERYVRHSLLT